MPPVFADPKTDFVFKRIFGDEKHKPLLIALLNDLLELKGARRITEVEHLPAEQRVAVPEMKLSIVDVKCTTARGRRFVVEMQVAKVKGLEKRIVYNASKAYVMQLRTAEKYPALCNVVGVTICNFQIWPRSNKDGEVKVPMLSRWRMQEQHSQELGMPQVQYVFLELPKYAAGKSPRTMVDKWAYFFREANDLSVEPAALSEAPFHEALEVARTATFSPLEWEAYERAKMAEQDARGMIVVAREEGLKEGRKEGREEGRKEGREEGHKEGREEGREEGHKKGKIEGQLEAKRDMLIRLLTRAGIELGEDDRRRILACVDAATLDRWTENVIGAKTVADVLT